MQRPMQNVNPLLETVPPDAVAEELSTSIKEIYMIPSTVRPEYEPSVVERYRYGKTTHLKVHPHQNNIGTKRLHQTDSRLASDCLEHNWVPLVLHCPIHTNFRI